MIILHVEDDEASVLLFRFALDEAQISSVVYRVSDGEQAIDFLRQAGSYGDAPVPDLVVVDLNLPKRDGFEVLAVMQSSSDLRQLRRVVLSASVVPGDPERVLAAGAHGFFRKPNSIDDLISTARSICGSAE